MDWAKLNPPPEVSDILAECPKVIVASTTAELIDLACGGNNHDFCEVVYDIPEKGRIVEATVARVRNGVSANYSESYMRRRDPESVLIGDDLPTDKETFQQRFGQDFAKLREEALAWLKTQELIVFGFCAGQPGQGLDALAIVPANAGFFALVKPATFRSVMCLKRGIKKSEKDTPVET